MSTEVRKKKKTGSRDNNKLIAILAISLSVIVVAVSVLTVVIFTSGNYVAKVNGQKLYNYEYEYYLNQQLSLLSEEIEIPDDATDEEETELYKTFFTTKDEDGQYPLARCKEEALKELKLFKTSYQLAVKNGYELTSEEASNVEDNVDYMISYYYQLYSQYDSSTTYDTIVSYICGNMSVSQYKEYAKQDTAIAKYMDAMEKTYEITEDELRAVYDENVNDYRVATVQKFFLSTMTTNEDGESVAMADTDKAAVKAKIDDYLAKFKSGELNYEETIKSASEESNASSTAGVSEINNSSLTSVTVVDEWALAKEAADAEGEYTVLEADNGYYIIRCNAVEDFDNSEDSSEGANDSISNTIKTKIANERSQEQMRSEAEAAEGYDLSDKKDERIFQIFDENATVVALISTYGAKVSD